MIISIENCDFTLRFLADRDDVFHPIAFFSRRETDRSSRLFIFEIETVRSTPLFFTLRCDVIYGTFSNRRVNIIVAV